MANIGEITRLQKELRAKAKARTAGVGELTRLQKRIAELSRQSGKPKPVLRPKKGLPIGQRLPTGFPTPRKPKPVLRRKPSTPIPNWPNKRGK